MAWVTDQECPAMNVDDQGKALCRAPDRFRRQIEVQRERPIAQRLPIDEAGLTPHAIRKGNIPGRIAILLTRPSGHLGRRQRNFGCECREGDRAGDKSGGKPLNHRVLLAPRVPEAALALRSVRLRASVVSPGAFPPFGGSLDVFKGSSKGRGKTNLPGGRSWRPVPTTAYRRFESALSSRVPGCGRHASTSSWPASSAM